MIKAIINFAPILVLFAFVSFTSCQSSTSKTEAADNKVQDAKQDLKEAQQDASAAHRAATAEEWQAFKNEVEMKIKENENRITELKAKMKTSGKKMDAIYEENINALEEKNKDLKNRINTYENNAQSDWEAFKREFNHDMDELGQALKDLTVNNKK